MPSQKILIVAGEASGDLHGGILAGAIKKISPDVELYALGGPKLANEGVPLLEDMLKHAVVGLIEVVKSYSIFRRILFQTLDWIKKEKPDVIVFIDFPGFNLKLAALAKKLGVKIVYFVSPQIWAWGKGRIWKIKALVDLMLVLFKFEETMYKEAGVNVLYVGHPILEGLPSEEDVLALIQPYHELREKTVIGLLPGSRPNEIQTHLPIMLTTAENLYKKNKSLHFILGLADGACPQIIRDLTAHTKIPLTIVESGAYTSIALSRLVLVAAGTVTLEAACFLKPMVILYKISWATWCLGRLVVDVPFLGMVNIVAGEEVAPECLQSQAKPYFIQKHVEAIIENPEREKEIVHKLMKVKERLVSDGAARKAARAILNILA